MILSRLVRASMHNDLNDMYILIYSHHYTKTLNNSYIYMYTHTYTHTHSHTHTLQIIKILIKSYIYTHIYTSIYENNMK